jgi:hypothetical protein
MGLQGTTRKFADASVVVKNSSGSAKPFESKGTKWIITKAFITDKHSTVKSENQGYERHLKNYS